MHGSQPAQLKCLLKENIDTLLVQVWDDQRKTPPKTQPENCVNIQKHPLWERRKTWGEKFRPNTQIESDKYTLHCNSNNCIKF